MYCPNCGAPNPDDAVFCGSCGTSLATLGPDNSNPGPAANTQMLPDPDDELQEEQGITNPIWQTVKGYLLYVILAGFLFTLFSLVTIRYSSHEDGDVDSGYVKLSGITMFTGAMPKIYNDQERRIMNSEILLDMNDYERKIARTPLSFRIAYMVLVMGIIFYLFTVFVYTQPGQRYLNSIARVICFLSAFAILWVYNDFENWQQQAVGERRDSSTNIESNYSIGFWLIFLSFLLLTIDYAAGTIKSTFRHVIAQGRNVRIKKIQTT